MAVETSATWPTAAAGTFESPAAAVVVTSVFLPARAGNGPLLDDALVLQPGGCCGLGILLLAAADSPVEVDQVIGGKDAGHRIQCLLGLIRHLGLVVQRQDLLGDEVV